jgi:hypothetical protein
VARAAALPAVAGSAAGWARSLHASSFSSRLRCPQTQERRARAACSRMIHAADGDCQGAPARSLARKSAPRPGSAARRGRRARAAAPWWWLRPLRIAVGPMRGAPRRGST